MAHPPGQDIAVKDEDITEEQVRRFLRKHTEFLNRNPDLLGDLLPPEQNLGNAVVDFQHYALKNLQRNSKALKTRYEGLVDFCRDNMSIQSQVHDAVLKLIRTRGLEQLLEVIAQDLAALFDVDVVRLAFESNDMAMLESMQNEPNASSIAFIEPGIVEAALPGGKQAVLVADTEKTPVEGFEQIFADMAGLVRSCALLRLKLSDDERGVLLAFGVRYNNRFSSGQGVELLTFLADIVAHQLEAHLYDLRM